MPRIYQTLESFGLFYVQKIFCIKKKKKRFHCGIERVIFMKVVIIHSLHNVIIIITTTKLDLSFYPVPSTKQLVVSHM